MTEAMRDTPATRLDRRAKYGHWDQFPSHPKPFHNRLAGKRAPRGGLPHAPQPRLARHRHGSR